jgi:signal transduction histidine kinase/ActR/RegA family two-component response regulator
VILSRPWSDFVHPDDQAASTEEFAREVALGHRTIHFVNRYIDVNGGIHWLDWSAEFDPATGVVYGTARDVTEERAAAQALLAARAEAERANLAKSAFLSRMSHELRTPLNIVLGFAELMEMDELRDEHRDYLRHITRAGNHLVDLINEVLDISRIESGQLAISPEPVAIGAVLDDVVSLVQPIAAARRVTVDRSGATCDEHVRADRQRLTQVLLNLIGNAIKYNRDGGSVHVECRIVADRLRIGVRDTGYGIPPDQIARLFTPFDRLGAEFGTIEGSGIGLALSKGLVEAMGGTIEIQSQVDIGSEFSVELDLVDAPLVTYDHGLLPPVGTRPSAGVGRQVILYIDDNASNLRLVEKILARRPQVEFVSVLQATVGLQIAHRRRPDLVLLDLHLPDMSGRDALERLRSHPLTRTTPVIVISADATKTQIHQVMASGAFGYLTKPISVRRFDDMVTAALDGRASDAHAS